jgi:hypothetical protein
VPTVSKQFDQPLEIVLGRERRQCVGDRPLQAVVVASRELVGENPRRADPLGGLWFCCQVADDPFFSTGSRSSGSQRSKTRAARAWSSDVRRRLVKTPKSEASIPFGLNSSSIAFARRIAYHGLLILPMPRLTRPRFE